MSLACNFPHCRGSQAINIYHLHWTPLSLSAVCHPTPRPNMSSAYLHCADYFIYPCRDINNSGSLNAALTANLPVIVPDMPELNWVLPECKVVMQKKSEATLDFNECFGRISNMSPDTYQNLKNGTERWKSERSWKRVSEKYMALYRGLLDG